MAVCREAAASMAIGMSHMSLVGWDKSYSFKRRLYCGGSRRVDNVND